MNKSTQTEKTVIKHCDCGEIDCPHRADYLARLARKEIQHNQVTDSGKAQKWLNIKLGDSPTLLGPFNTEAEAHEARPSGNVKPDKRIFVKSFQRYVPHGTKFYSRPR